jgi:predicted phage gp36 major capsid-like protein
MTASELVTIDCEIKQNNPDKEAIAVADGTEEIIKVSGKKVEKWFWLPRSQIEINDDGTVTMPRWLAQNKGLI